VITLTADGGLNRVVGTNPKEAGAVEVRGWPQGRALLGGKAILKMIKFLHPQVRIPRQYSESKTSIF
jgi:hypothetical protein